MFITILHTFAKFVIFGPKKFDENSYFHVSVTRIFYFEKNPKRKASRYSHHSSSFQPVNDAQFNEMSQHCHEYEENSVIKQYFQNVGQ